MSNENLKTVEKWAKELVEGAKNSGVVVTIEQKPLQPFAMGNYESVVSVREVRT